MTLEEFNAASPERVNETLLACCDVPSWAAVIREGRPYPDVDAALETADKAASGFTAGDVERALAAHPRIGERAAGDTPEAAWSRQEQSTVSRDSETETALAAGNRAYEERFGRVFLICASGRSAEEILVALRQRLANDEDKETAVVAEELRKIALLRLRRVLES